MNKSLCWNAFPLFGGKFLISPPNYHTITCFPLHSFCGALFFFNFEDCLHSAKRFGADTNAVGSPKYSLRLFLSMLPYVGSQHRICLYAAPTAHPSNCFLWPLLLPGVSPFGVVFLFWFFSSSWCFSSTNVKKHSFS